MSKNCQNCRYFQWLPKPWSADQREDVWKCKLNQEESIYDTLNPFISGVTWIGDSGRNTNLQCKLIARKCDSYEGKSCRQCKYLEEVDHNIPEMPIVYLSGCTALNCKLGKDEEIYEDSAVVNFKYPADIEDGHQALRYFAKRCEEYDNGSA